MKTSCFYVIALAMLSFSLSSTAHAATFSIEFYTGDQLIGNQDYSYGGVTIDSARKLVGAPMIVGSMEIKDSALGVPNAFIPLDSPDLVSFRADFGVSSFELPGDLLRLVELGKPADEQLGVRLDPQGHVQRFDIPRSQTSNRGAIWDDDPVRTEPPTSLILLDENPNSQEQYFIEQDGELFILTQQQTTSFFDFTERPNVGNRDDTIITPLGMMVLDGQVGGWRISAPNANPLNNLKGYLRIVEVSASPVPVPATAWLLLSGVGVIVGISRRTKPLS